MFDLLLTEPFPCGYLTEKMAQSLVAVSMTQASQYSRLAQAGFRRSGQYVYRPHCKDCQACIPVRVDVSCFKPNRSQRRAWVRHANLDTRTMPPSFEQEHFSLYRNYQKVRHPGGGMDNENPDQYRDFLLSSPVKTQLVEFRENGILRMVSLIDEIEGGLSSVYTFFDPELDGASLGTYNILWQIGRCNEMGLPYLYLGYWVRESRKMAYKARFRPIEKLAGNQWIPFDDI